MRNILRTCCVALVPVFLVAGVVQADLNQGLVAYYPFNGNANDQSGNGNHGIVYGASLTEDRFGNANSAYTFNNDPIYRVSAQSYISVPSSPSLMPTNSISISLWIKTSDSRGWTIIGKEYGTSSMNSYLMYYHPGSTLIFDCQTTNGDQRIGVSIPSLDEWHNIIGVWHGSEMKLYIDGNEVSSGTSDGQILYDNNPMIIGADDDDGNDIPDSGWNGVIDDVRIYNRPLSESEIQELYLEGTNQPPTANAGSDQIVFDEVHLDGSLSHDPDGTMVAYEWNLHHRDNPSYNRLATGPNPTVSDLFPGFYDVSLTVTDDGGSKATDSMLLAASGQCSGWPDPNANLNMSSFRITKGKRNGRTTTQMSGNIIDLPELILFNGDTVRSRITIELFGSLPGGDDLVVSEEAVLNVTETNKTLDIRK